MKICSNSQISPANNTENFEPNTDSETDETDTESDITDQQLEEEENDINKVIFTDVNTDNEEE